jgi:hypothetical protein
MNEQDISKRSKTKLDDESRPIFRTNNAMLAEHIRLLLAIEDVRAAVIQGDPLQVGFAIVDVVVLVEEHKATQRILETSNQPNHTEDWYCPDCDETIPMTFDICWNCGRLHPEISDDAEHRVFEADSCKWGVVAC